MKKLTLVAMMLVTSYAVESTASNIVAFDVTAQVTQLSVPQPGLSIGDTFTLRLQYDADAGGSFFSTSDVTTNHIVGDFNETHSFHTDVLFQMDVNSIDAASYVSIIAVGQTIPYLFGDGLGGPAEDEFSNVYIYLEDSAGLNFVPSGIPETLDLSDFDTATLTMDTGYSAGVTFNAVEAIILDITPVPEPSSLLLAVLASVGLLRRRHRR